MIIDNADCPLCNVDNFDYDDPDCLIGLCSDCEDKLEVWYYSRTMEAIMLAIAKECCPKCGQYSNPENDLCKC